VSDLPGNDTDALRDLRSKLLRNSLTYRRLKRTGRPGRPQAMSIEITRRCIAKCTMCGIWRTPAPAPDLELEEWLALLSHPLVSDLRELDVTGGEPFLKEELPDLVSSVGKLAQSNLGRLRSVAITTNGLLTSVVLRNTDRMATELAKARLDLIIVCALDAVGPLHDEIRGVPHAWQRLEETLAGLKSLRATHQNLILGHKTTVLPCNVAELDRIAAYAESNGLFSIISPFIATGGRYLNTDLRERLVFSDDDRAGMLRFFRGSGGGWDYHSKALARYLETGHMRKPCSCGFNYFFVRSTGQVLPCPLLTEDIGSLRDSDIGDLWNSDKACRLRRGTGAFAECRDCTEPGLERFALPFEGREYLSLMSELGAEGFLRAHRHMGLDKYL
jgi:MoaA/NifB/PqqE/SkfB family radical SAM enzyme